MMVGNYCYKWGGGYQWQHKCQLHNRTKTGNKNTCFSHFTPNVSCDGWTRNKNSQTVDQFRQTVLEVVRFGLTANWPPKNKLRI